MSKTTDDLKNIGSTITSEHILLVLFLTISVVAFWEAYEFTYGGRVFPQLTASIVIVGTLLILFQDYLPKSVQSIIKGSVDLVDQDEIETESQSESDVDLAGAADTTLPRFQKPIGPVLFTSIMIVLYTVVGWAIGFLWASPIFAAVYTLWFDKQLLYVILTAALALGIAYVFIAVFGIRLHEGEFITIGESISPAMIWMAVEAVEPIYPIGEVIA